MSVIHNLEVVLHKRPFVLNEWMDTTKEWLIHKRSEVTSVEEMQKFGMETVDINVAC